MVGIQFVPEKFFENNFIKITTNVDKFLASNIMLGFLN